MARLTPTINSTHYSGVFGDRKVKMVTGTIAGTYAAAAVDDGGALLTPELVGLEVIEHVELSPTFTADSIEELPTSLGKATGTPGWVIALRDKDDNLETGAGAVTGVTFTATITGY